MNKTAPFVFKRTKGIVWVCDLAKSSSYLKSNVELDREKEKISKEVFDAADLLTFMTNVTQLGLLPTKEV